MTNKIETQITCCLTHFRKSGYVANSLFATFIFWLHLLAANALFISVLPNKISFLAFASTLHNTSSFFFIIIAVFLLVISALLVEFSLELPLELLLTVVVRRAVFLLEIVVFTLVCLQFVPAWDLSFVARMVYDDSLGLVFLFTEARREDLFEGLIGDFGPADAYMVFCVLLWVWNVVIALLAQDNWAFLLAYVLVPWGISSIVFSEGLLFAMPVGGGLVAVKDISFKLSFKQPVELQNKVFQKAMHKVELGLHPNSSKEAQAMKLHQEIREEATKFLFKKELVNVGKFFGEINLAPHLLENDNERLIWMHLHQQAAIKGQLVSVPSEIAAKTDVSWSKRFLYGDTARRDYDVHSDPAMHANACMETLLGKKWPAKYYSIVAGKHFEVVRPGVSGTGSDAELLLESQKLAETDFKVKRVYLGSDLKTASEDMVFYIQSLPHAEISKYVAVYQIPETANYTVNSLETEVRARLAETGLSFGEISIVNLGEETLVFPK